MAIKINYNGADITDKIQIMQCTARDSVANNADVLYMEFADAEKNWRDWQPQKGDTVKITDDYFNSGKMYVDTARQESGKYIVEAISTPLGIKDIKSKIWRDTTLLTIAQEIAANNGLSLQTYHTSDYSFISMAQDNESDLSFLCRICQREGYTIKVDDGKLIIFDLNKMAKSAVSQTIKATECSPESNFEKNEDMAHSVTVLCSILKHTDKKVICTDIKATAESAQFPDGKDITITEKVSNAGEAQRVAKGKLQEINKHSIVGYIKMPFISKIAAGSVVNASGFSEYDGKYMVESVINDLAVGKSTLNLYKVLEG